VIVAVEMRSFAFVNLADLLGFVDLINLLRLVVGRTVEVECRYVD